MAKGTRAPQAAADTLAPTSQVDTSPHVPVHGIPWYGGDVADPRGGIRWVVPEKAKYWEGDQPWRPPISKGTRPEAHPSNPMLRPPRYMASRTVMTHPSPSRSISTASPR